VAQLTIMTQFTITNRGSEFSICFCDWIFLFSCA
jgi:hypothetical protein